ncbi:hypothetical protein Ccrd_003693, partial [Cynara cardunculus var. scolymus]
MVEAQPTVDELSPKPEQNQDEPSSSHASGEVSDKFEKKVASGRNGAVVDNGRDDGGRVSNGAANSSGSDGRSLPSLHNLSSEIPSSHKLESPSSQLRLRKLASDISSSEKLDSPSSQVRLEKSKTEKPRRNNILVEEASQIFDENISVHQKLKLLNRIATVKDDGTVEFDIPADVEPHAYGAGAGAGAGAGEVQNECNEDTLDSTEPRYFPPLQIVMLIVGTRGDVQPFVAIGKRLQVLHISFHFPFSINGFEYREYGHRVRLATHSNFKEFVLTAGLEFYPLGGDPKVLAEYMVKNKGFLPSGPSEIPVQRSQMKDIIFSLFPACREPDLDTGISFRAEAIIANPPAYGHTHVAEALKIPIHIFFTMPWTPTSEFPHPLSRVKQPAGYRVSSLPLPILRMQLSYQIVDSLIWLGIRDMINDVRKKKLKLRPVTYLSGSQGSESHIPHGYIWSPHLVPKPKELLSWLKAGPKPIYIGFGSLPVQEPEKMTQIIVQALEMTGQRGIINKGWGGLGNCKFLVPSSFAVSLTVHHGGAGTTAAGLKAACPTTIVPFFGDQPFWGERVHARGVGPPPIPVDQFSLPKLVDAIKFMLDPKVMNHSLNMPSVFGSECQFMVKEQAVELAKAMEQEDGVDGAVKAFLRHLPRNTPEVDSPTSAPS